MQNMRIFKPILLFIILLLLAELHCSCTHETMMGEEPIIDSMMVDTTIIDTMIVDTMDYVPCDDEIIYFFQDVLPILKINCAISGCHDANTARDGIRLDNYDDVISTTGTEPFDLDKSDLYEVITESDSDKLMPPPPRSSLSSTEIDIIATWILQGATNDSCGIVTDACEITDRSYARDIAPVLRVECQGCHSGPSPSGGIAISTYTDVKALADNGQLVAVIDWQPGVSRMPQGRPQLPDCFRDQLRAWIAQGALDN